jgi:hypothetical protein
MHWMTRFKERKSDPGALCSSNRLPDTSTRTKQLTLVRRESSSSALAEDDKPTALQSFDVGAKAILAVE